MSNKLGWKRCMLCIVIILTFMLAGCSKKANGLYQSALKNYDKGKYETAASEFKKAIELRNDYADYYIDYGYCLIAMQDFGQAQSMFEKAILDKDNSIVDKNNKKAYRGLGVLYYQQGDYENALNNFTKAKEIKSLKKYDLDIVSYMGSCNLMLGNYEEAVKNFTDVLKDHPKKISALISRAAANYELQKYEECIADYTSAQKQEKNNYEIYIGLFNAYQAQKKDSDAQDILNKATAIKPKTAKDRYFLAKIHYYQGNIDQALDEFKEAFDQGYSDSYYFIGDIYMSNKDYTSAVYYFEQYESSNATKTSAFYSRLGMCYLEDGQYQKALDAILAGLKTASAAEKKSLLHNEIAAYEHLGDFETAYTKMQSYLEAYPKDKKAKRDLKFLETRQPKESTEDSNQEGAPDEIVKP